MSANDGNIAWLRIGIVHWNVLLHSQAKCVFLLDRCAARIFPDMLAWQYMFNNMKKIGRHDRKGILPQCEGFFMLGSPNKSQLNPPLKGVYG